MYYDKAGVTISEEHYLRLCEDKDYKKVRRDGRFMGGEIVTTWLGEHQRTRAYRLRTRIY